MNSYVTVTFADNYFFTTPNYKLWFELDKVTKERALTAATTKINSLVYPGIKTNLESENEFPRNGQTIVPKFVEYACMEEALAIGTNTDTTRQDLINQGVTAFSIGDLSESYDKNIAKDDLNIFVSAVSKNYLKKFMGGAFNVF